LSLYRVFQESLTNIMRHSGATRVHIALHCRREGVTLTIEDNGKGIPKGKLNCNQSFGLIGMRERVSHCGGTMTITAGPQQGTRVYVHIPLGKEKTRHCSSC